MLIYFFILLPFPVSKISPVSDFVILGTDPGKKRTQKLSRLLSLLSIHAHNRRNNLQTKNPPQTQEKKNPTQNNQTFLEMCNTQCSVVLWPGISSTYVNKMSIHQLFDVASRYPCAQSKSCIQQSFEEKCFKSLMPSCYGSIITFSPYGLFCYSFQNVEGFLSTIL